MSWRTATERTRKNDLAANRAFTKARKEDAALSREWSRAASAGRNDYARKLEQQSRACNATIEAARAYARLPKSESMLVEEHRVEAEKERQRALVRLGPRKNPSRRWRRR
jgi:hypothetical protein